MTPFDKVRTALDNASKRVNNEMDKLRSENNQLRSEVARLESEDKLLRASNIRPSLREQIIYISRLEAENRVLKNRPPMIDPLLDPVRQLPPELQAMVRTNAFRIADGFDLDAFFSASYSFIGDDISMALKQRPRWFTAFLRANTIDLKCLASRSLQIEEFATSIGCALDVWHSLKALRIGLMLLDLISDASLMFPAPVSTDELQKALKQCTSTVNLTLDFSADALDLYIYGEDLFSMSDEDILADSGWSDALRALRSLQGVVLRVDLNPDPEFVLYQPTWRNRLRSLTAEVAQIFMEGNPSCQIEIVEGPGMSELET